LLGETSSVYSQNRTKIPKIVLIFKRVSLAVTTELKCVCNKLWRTRVILRNRNGRKQMVRQRKTRKQKRQRKRSSS